jgi:hypothetical protein
MLGSLCSHESGGAMSSSHTARVISTALAVVAGIAFAYMGFGLYQSGVESSVAANIKFSSWEFVVAGAGPGLIFAVAGALMVVVSLNRKLGDETKKTDVTHPDGRVENTLEERSYGKQNKKKEL